MLPGSEQASDDELIVGEHLYKVFGDTPGEALELVEQGVDRDEILERTGQTVAVHDASFEIRRGEIFVVMGLSGSGKSTLLRLLNRLIEPTAGTIRIAGQDVTAMSGRELIELRRRDLSMVFQSFALMPHQRVWENAAFGLDVAGVPRKDRRERALAVLEQVGLASYADSHPHELSGGMQQRVGLARALVAEPTILLMDEAFSALDPLIRAQMQDELLALQRERDLTVVFVSHDLDEAMRIGDRIAIMEAGRILQIGSPEEILREPADDHVRSFFGSVDVTSLLSASDIAAPEQVVLRSDGGVQAALETLARHERDHGCVCDRDGLFLGTVSVDSLRDLESSGESALSGAYVDTDPIAAGAGFDDVVTRLARAPVPLSVVDGDGHLVGTITRTRLLEALAARGGQ